jgi:hypothetical protein
MDTIKDVEEALVKKIEMPKRQISRISDISDREGTFIAEYCACFNKVQAYRKAYNDKGHADEIAIKAETLMNRPEIEKRIKNELAKKLDSKLSTAPHLLMDLIGELMNMDMTDFYEDDGLTTKPLSEIPAEKRKFLRIGKPTVNNRTGEVYTTYEIPTFSQALDKLLDVVKLVTTVNAKNPAGDGDLDETRERRERILNQIE